MTVHVWADAETVALAAAEQFVTRGNEALAAHGRFAVVLAGGSTPKALYQMLASESFAGRLDWGRVDVFWGDERCVPPDHTESNYRMAQETLLGRVPIPPERVQRIAGELAPELAAAQYEALLRDFFGMAGARGAPRFDLVLLGMGADGHTASLFPGDAAVQEAERWVVAPYVEPLGAWRVTLTPVALNGGAVVMFLVTGGSKAERLAEVISGPYEPERLPVQVVRPGDGDVVWMVDEAAAGGLVAG